MYFIGTNALVNQVGDKYLSLPKGT